MSATKRKSESSSRIQKKPKLEVQQTLYIKNIDDKIRKRVLRHNLYLLFSTFGDVLDINLKLRGAAHVVFESTESASRALKLLQNTQFFGRALVIDFSIAKTKSVQIAETAIAEDIP